MNREKTKRGKQEARIMEQFGYLVNRLSPENLHCDGEISAAQAAKRKAQIMREWAELERQLGRKMTEEDVYRYEMERMRICA